MLLKGACWSANQLCGEQPKAFPKISITWSAQLIEGAGPIGVRVSDTPMDNMNARIANAMFTCWAGLWPE